MKLPFVLLVATFAAMTLNACELEQPLGECTPGTRQCEEEIFYECMRDGKNWESVVCDSHNKLGAFCNVSHICVACNDDEDCGLTEKHCVDHACRPLSVKACREDSTKCEDGKVTTCIKKAWENEVMCTNGCNIENTACQPAGNCAPNATKCMGDGHLTCSKDGLWLMDTDCSENSQFCDAGKGCVECISKSDCKDTTKPICNANTNSCQAANAVCAKSETMCEGAKLLTCTDDGKWGAGQSCDAGKECIDGGKTCTTIIADTCKNGDAKCEGDTLLKCTSGQWVSENCTTKSQVCNAVGCVECNDNLNCKQPTKPFCSTSMACVECLVNKDCKGTKSLCAAKTHVCQAPFCQVGETKCEGVLYKTCNAKQTGFTSTVCGFGLNATKSRCDTAKGCVECLNNADCKGTNKTVCNLGTKACQIPDVTCAQDAKKCENGSSYTCSANTWLKDGAACLYGCNAEGTACAACAKGEKRCVDSTFQQCNATQTDYDITICSASTPICDESLGCIECRDLEGCLDPQKPVCNTKTHTCEALACINDSIKCEIDTLYICIGELWSGLKMCMSECNATGTDCN